MDKVIEKRRWTPKRIAIIAGVTLVLFLVVFVYVRAKGKSRLNVASERISIEKVQQAKFQEFIPITGVVQPITTVYLDAVEGGSVEERFIEDGKMVKKGDAILRLSNPQLQMDCINREAQLLDQQNNIRSTLLGMDQRSVTLKEQLLQIELDLQQARRTFEINKTLNGDKLIARIDYEKAEEQYNYLQGRRKLVLKNIESDSLFRANQEDQMRASLVLIQKNLAFLQTSLQHLTIKAPIDGQLSSLKAELGETKAKGENIAQIDILTDFKVRARIGEHYISRVFPGLTGIFRFDGKDYKLKIAKIYPEVSNGEFEVDMMFEEEKPQGIKRGQNLQIKLALGDETQATLLPRGGFYQHTGGNWVYVVKGATAQRRDIKLGRQNPDFYEVLEGLEAGEEVITSKYDAYNDADELIIQTKQ